MRTPEGKTLHECVVDSDAQGIQALLAAGADPDAVDADGRAPLHLAASRSRWPKTTVNELLRCGADPGLRDHRGRTAEALVREQLLEILQKLPAKYGVALQDRFLPDEYPNERIRDDWARAHGVWQILRLALTRQFLRAADPALELADADGFTSLHLAAQDNDADAIQRRIDAGVSVHRKNRDGATPLMCAAAAGSAAAVRTLARYDRGWHERTNPADSNTVHLAALSGSPATLEAVLEAAALEAASRKSETLLADLCGHINGDYRTPLDYALRTPGAASASRMARALVAHGAEVSSRQVQRAAHSGLVGLCSEWLRDHPVAPDDYILIAAVHSQSFDTVRVVLDARKAQGWSCEPSSEGPTPQMVARTLVRAAEGVGPHGMAVAIQEALEEAEGSPPAARPAPEAPAPEAGM